jgi:hypothetical protein
MNNITNIDRRVPLIKSEVCKMLGIANKQRIPSKLNKKATKTFGGSRWYIDDIDWFLETEWEIHCSKNSQQTKTKLTSQSVSLTKAQLAIKVNNDRTEKLKILNPF